MGVAELQLRCPMKNFGTLPWLIAALCSLLVSVGSIRAEEADGGDAKAEPGALTAFADVDASSGDAPHAVKLSVEVVDGTGNPPFTFIWDFGDATEFSTDRDTTHTYKIPGNFRASVIVTDSKGETDQDYYDISVNEVLADGAITAEQLMKMLPPGEVAPVLKNHPLQP